MASFLTTIIRPSYSFLPSRLPNRRCMVTMKKDEVRPSLDDVERISWGLAARKRGTGSRAVPHRLNAVERVEWEFAKKRRYLLLRGTGWRKERGDSPLANVYRLYCDSNSVPCITVERGLGIDVEDVVTIDFSTLRTRNISDLVVLCANEAKKSDLFPSLKVMDDRSDLTSLGWEYDDSSFENNAIWRLPAITLQCCFKDRGEARRYAEFIAASIANGKLYETYTEDDPSEDISGNLLYLAHPIPVIRQPKLE
eukprot:gene12158-25511_t